MNLADLDKIVVALALSKTLPPKTIQAIESSLRHQNGTTLCDWREFLRKLIECKVLQREDVCDCVKMAFPEASGAAIINMYYRELQALREDRPDEFNPHQQDLEFWGREHGETNRRLPLP